jgi:hypothetical protein
MPSTRLNTKRQRVETPEAADYLKDVDTTQEETEDGQSGEETEDDESDEADQRDLCLCAKLRPPVNEGQPYIAMICSNSPLQVGYGTSCPVAMLLYSIEDRHGVKVSLLGIQHDEMSVSGGRHLPCLPVIDCLCSSVPCIDTPYRQRYDTCRAVIQPG